MSLKKQVNLKFFLYSPESTKKSVEKVVERSEVVVRVGANLQALVTSGTAVMKKYDQQFVFSNIQSLLV